MCPNCGDPFSISHALKCKKGAWIRRRHEEVKAVWAVLFKKVSRYVDLEPYLPAAIGVEFSKGSTTRDPDARADILVRGLFQPLQETFLDVAVVHTGADGYSHLSSSQVLRSKETAKRSKYEERA